MRLGSRRPASIAAGMILALSVVAIVLVARTPFGGWVQSFFAGSGVR